jgi:hypothetical protein
MSNLDYKTTIEFLLFDACNKQNAKDASALVVELGKAIGTLCGMAENKKAVNEILETVFLSIRAHAMFMHEKAIVAKVKAESEQDQLVTTEEFLDKHYKPEKFNG